MAKPELEFFRPDHVPWTPVAGSASAGAAGPGIEEQVLSRDPVTGDLTRLLRFAPGVRTVRLPEQRAALRDAVPEMRPEIWVERAERQGTTFHVLIPHRAG